MSTEVETPKHFVAVGASAGGVEALQSLFENIQRDGHTTYFVIQHLSPDYKSVMGSLMEKVTNLSVVEAKDGVEVAVDHLYLIPPGKTMMLGEGQLLISDQYPSARPNFPIDIFFRSLAEDKQNQCVGIILSGTGSDGSRGILAIKEVGGLVLVQDPQEAKFDGMPNSAIQSGCVDVIVKTTEMAQRLGPLLEHPVFSQAVDDVMSAENQYAFDDIYRLLESRSEVDFTAYKSQTIKRRIARRMGICQIQSVREYRDLLVNDAEELILLSKDMLIGVTRFFRDSSFQVLEEDIFPKMMEELPQNKTLRIWSAGCSTGEEAISLAILVDEYSQRTGRPIDVKIFATDLDPDAIAIASIARFNANIIDDLGEERFHTYFQPEGDSFVLIPRVRKMIIYAVHNLLSDPPFSNSDLVVCRNVLIYFELMAQKRVLSMLQFALRIGGYLFLGSAETVKGVEQNCRIVSERDKIFQKVSHQYVSLPAADPRKSISRRVVPDIASVLKSYEESNPAVLPSIANAILEDQLPPSILVDEDGRSLHFYGDVHRYTVNQTKGVPSSNVLDLLHDAFTVPLSIALNKAVTSKQPYLMETVELEFAEEAVTLDIRISPYKNSERGMEYYLISLLETAREDKPEQKNVVVERFDKDVASLRRIRDLEEELRNVTRGLQVSLEERETANEELQSSNEELLAANEELQSTNEELQSVNEELYTVNSEYQVKIGEVVASKADLNSLINALDMGIVFLDSDLCVRIFNEAAKQYINLIDSDVGRSLSQITSSLSYDNLLGDIADCLMNGTLKQQLVRNESGESNEGDEAYEVALTPTSTQSYGRKPAQVKGCILTIKRVNM